MGNQEKHLCVFCMITSHFFGLLAPSFSCRDERDLRAHFKLAGAPIVLYTRGILLTSTLIGRLAWDFEQLVMILLVVLLMREGQQGRQSCYGHLFDFHDAETGGSGKRTLGVKLLFTIEM